MSAEGKEGFKSSPRDAPPLYIMEKMMCSKIAWYVGIGQVQLLLAFSETEASHFSCEFPFQ